jgi:hypothetical protein
MDHYFYCGSGSYAVKIQSCECVSRTGTKTWDFPTFSFDYIREFEKHQVELIQINESLCSSAGFYLLFMKFLI